MTEELKHLSAFCINICILYLHLHPCNNMLDTAGMQHSSTAMSRLKAAFRCFPSIDSGWPKMTLRLGAYNKWISVRSKHSSVSAANDIHFYLHEFRHKPWQHDDTVMTTWWEHDKICSYMFEICRSLAWTTAQRLDGPRRLRHLWLWGLWRSVRSAVRSAVRSSVRSSVRHARRSGDFFDFVSLDCPHSRLLCVQLTQFTVSNVSYCLAPCDAPFP